VSYSSRLDLIT